MREEKFFSGLGWKKEFAKREKKECGLRRGLRDSVANWANGAWRGGGVFVARRKNETEKKMKKSLGVECAAEDGCEVCIVDCDDLPRGYGALRNFELDAGGCG